MDDKSIDKILHNYYELTDKIDLHVSLIEKTYSKLIACTKGCDSCCKALTLFPVEAVSISRAFNKLPDMTKEAIKNRIKTEHESCPALINHICAIYPARPIICRTHGYPIYLLKNNKPFVDFCQKNFNGIKSFPNEALLDIDQLNATLAAINRFFLEMIESDVPLPDRIPISQALLLLEN